MTGAALAVAIAVAGALAAGILIGRYYVPDDRTLKRTARHARIYLRALGHLISRDRDRAIEELQGAVAENVSDLEPYFALGALFRGRGEWERAIRIHQALELRARADKKLRRRARFELGLDFRMAGMPRRAIRALEECLAEQPKHEPALRALAGLYEQSGRLAEAAAAWRRLRKLSGERSPRELHMAAAAARAAAAAGDLDAAKRHARDAERLDAGHPHSLAAAAALAEARGNPRQAGELVAQLAAAAPQLAAHAAGELRRVERARLGESATEHDVCAAVLARLESAAAEGPASHSPHLRLAIAEHRAEIGEVEDAAIAYREIVERAPDVLPAHIQRARSLLVGGDEEALSAALAALAGPGGVLAPLAQGLWRCAFCGEVAESFVWQCSECRQWGWIRLEIGWEALSAPPAPRDRRAELRRYPTASVSREAAEDPGDDEAAGRRGRGGDGNGSAGGLGAWVAGAWRAMRPRRDREETRAEDGKPAQGAG